MFTTAALQHKGKLCTFEGRKGPVHYCIRVLLAALTASASAVAFADEQHSHVSGTNDLHYEYFYYPEHHTLAADTNDQWIINYDWGFEDKGRLGFSLTTDQTVGSAIQLQSLSLGGNLAYGLIGTEDFQLLQFDDRDHINLSTRYSLGGFNATLALNKYRALGTAEDYQSLDKNLVTDLELNYGFGNGLTLTLGGNNIFDNLPSSTPSSINDIEGLTMDPQSGELRLRSLNHPASTPVLFPLGTEGTYYYFKATYEF